MVPVVYRKSVVACAAYQRESLDAEPMRMSISPMLEELKRLQGMSVHSDLAVDFKRCCMMSGKFDGYSR
jgi:hypothetical protein